MAERVRTLLVPAVHSAVSDAGWLAQRHAKFPCWGSAAWAAEVGWVFGLKVTGR